MERESRGLEGEECNEKAEVAPKQARNLSLNRRAREHVRRQVLPGSGSSSGEREEHRENRVDNRRCLLDSIGLLIKEEE